MAHAWSENTLALLRVALEEDLAQAGDISGALVDPDEAVTARIVPREGGLICGLGVLAALGDLFNDSRPRPVAWATSQISDGDRVAAGQTVSQLRGARSAVLAIERVLLNFLGRMSGVATLTRRYVDIARAANPDVMVMDTRKTLPGWRELDKYAVRCGGGVNHREGLFDAILIKDNHLAGVTTDRLASTLFDMLNRIAELPVKPRFVEVEVDDLEQFDQVCRVVGVNIVLLDNFPADDLQRAVELRAAHGLTGKLALEASGGVSLETIGDIAATGVDRISVGALTHSAPSLDIGLDM